MTEIPADISDLELIGQAIEASGLSARRFAQAVAFGRDERTIRRWQSGEIPIPDRTRERLLWFVRLSATKRRQLVELLDEE
jgi:hypothetical protein